MWVVKEIRKNVYRKFYKPDAKALWVLLCAFVLVLVLKMGVVLLGI